VSFISALFNLIIASYIRTKGGLETVGLYNAGTTIITSYFGIVITAMTTDYYPRISAVHFDNKKLTEEVNRQSEVGLTLIFPLSIVFVFFSPFFMQFLYSKDFLETIYYTNFAILGAIIIVCSNCMGMILLAKQAANVFMVSVLGQRIVLIGIYIYLFNHFGLLGLGMAYLMTGVIHLLLMSLIIGYKYNIWYKREIYFQLFVVLFSTVLAIYFRKIEDAILRNIFGILILTFSCFYSYYLMKKNMGIDIVFFVKDKFNKRRR
jgi:O-antigen/teichoic acid export membrane protein